ncbi:MAG: patatin-like phospholipase family protein, partial [Acidobacteria bacterium]|nr:patatin-like phospholipase family protein [Acidobacteriota bacterium]
GEDWIFHSKRVADIVDNQVRSLRIRQLVASYRAPAGDENHRKGAYWSIRSDLREYAVPNVLPCPLDRTNELAEIETRLAAMSAETQERLMNWGYAICDAALRRYLDPSLPPPRGFPYPNAGV